MCGIAGFATLDGSAPPQSTLDAFVVALRHRGPDGVGRLNAPGLGMVQTRLAIIDLKTGDQPLYGADQTALVANGEIYNYVELKAAFGAERFATGSDCEVALHTFAEHRGDFTRPLRGMYAVALSDSRQGALQLARDPFGIKPLYYTETPHGLAFASEPGALLQAGLVERRTRPEKANELLQLQFSTGRPTLFAGIERILPGETLEIGQGRIRNRRIQPALPDGPPREISETEALDILEKVLIDSVTVHQRSDVPYGCPETEARDERAHAHKVAAAVGAEHVTIEVTEQDFYTYLPFVVASMDDPAADYAIVPSWLLAREAAKELKVVLCGEGGDELFAGYGRYRSVMRPRLFGGRKMRRRGALDGMDILRDESPSWRSGIVAAEEESHRHGWNRLQSAQAVDVADWLPHDLLVKLDRCLMAHGLEGRTPFLDPAVAHFAFALPDRLKIARGQGKYILRLWLDRALPEADAFSPKRGFQVPVAEWIAMRAAKLAPLVAGSAGIAELCRPGTVARLFHSFAASGGKREGAACWHLLFYALWHRIHIEDAKPQADILATLAG
jgi:asparagine synthase (glutamine-hydrolysing)